MKEGNIPKFCSPRESFKNPRKKKQKKKPGREKCYESDVTLDLNNIVGSISCSINQRLQEFSDGNFSVNGSPQSTKIIIQPQTICKNYVQDWVNSDEIEQKLFYGEVVKTECDSVFGSSDPERNKGIPSKQRKLNSLNLDKMPKAKGATKAAAPKKVPSDEDSDSEIEFDQLVRNDPLVKDLLPEDKSSGTSKDAATANAASEEKRKKTSKKLKSSKSKNESSGAIAESKPKPFGSVEKTTGSTDSIKSPSLLGNKKQDVPKAKKKRNTGVVADDSTSLPAMPDLITSPRTSISKLSQRYRAQQTSGSKTPPKTDRKEMEKDSASDSSKDSSDSESENIIASSQAKLSPSKSHKISPSKKNKSNLSVDSMKQDLLPEVQSSGTSKDAATANAASKEKRKKPSKKLKSSKSKNESSGAIAESKPKSFGAVEKMTSPRTSISKLSQRYREQQTRDSKTPPKTDQKEMEKDSSESESENIIASSQAKLSPSKSHKISPGKKNKSNLSVNSMKQNVHKAADVVVPETQVESSAESSSEESENENPSKSTRKESAKNLMLTQSKFQEADVNKSPGASVQKETVQASPRKNSPKMKLFAAELSESSTAKVSGKGKETELNGNSPSTVREKLDMIDDKSQTPFKPLELDSDSSSEDDSFNNLKENVIVTPVTKEKSNLQDSGHVTKDSESDAESEDSTPADKNVQDWKLSSSVSVRLSPTPKKTTTQAKTAEKAFTKLKEKAKASSPRITRANNPSVSSTTVDKAVESEAESSGSEDGLGVSKSFAAELRKRNQRETAKTKPETNKTQTETRGQGSLCLEDIDSADTELWLIRAPVGVDLRTLENKKILLEGKQSVGSLGKADASYEIQATRLRDTNAMDFMALFPRRNQGQIGLGPDIAGQLNVVQSVIIPPVIMPIIQPKYAREMPEGLKPRYQPFGSDSPVRSKRQTTKTRKHHKHSERLVQKASSDPQEIPSSSEMSASPLPTVSSHHKKRKKKSRRNDEPSGVEEDSADTDHRERHKKKKRKQHHEDATKSEVECAREQSIPPSNVTDEVPKKKRKKHKKSSLVEDASYTTDYQSPDQTDGEEITKKRKKHKKSSHVEDRSYLTDYQSPDQTDGEEITKKRKKHKKSSHVEDTSYTTDYQSPDQTDGEEITKKRKKKKKKNKD